MSDDELKDFLIAQPETADTSGEVIEQNAFDTKLALTKIPSALDYRKSGKVSSIKNQKPCGSCYAFAAAAAIESQYLLHQNISLDLSEQAIVDCEVHSFKCKGGQIGKSFSYVKENGISLESCYPYLAQGGTCSHRCDSKRYKITGYRKFGSTESLYALNLNNYGPFVMYLNVPRAFVAYKSGVLDIPGGECEKLGAHFVLIVGYTSDYWIAKNSCRTDWGEDGYVRFKRGQNFCHMTARVVTPFL